MTTPHTAAASVPVAARLEDVDAATLLGVCASLKPASGRQDRSAARSILSYALETVGAVYPRVSMLDLRDHPPPFFDGRMPRDYDDPNLELVWSSVGRAGALLLAVPAYWSGVSGVFKNFVDVLCGPTYDLGDGTTTVFEDKPVGLLIVGADDVSTPAGAIQAQEIMRSTGARLIGQPVLVANPRTGGLEEAGLSHELIALGAELARHAHVARRSKTQ